MSITFIVMTMLLGSLMTIAFVLQPLKEELAASDNSSVSRHRCQGESLQSIRKGLLEALNLQVEPQLAAGGLDGVREQWRSTFSNIAHRGKQAAVPAISSYSVSPDGGNGLTCCSMATEVFMKDLGWDNWVVHPASLTIVQCAVCNPGLQTVQCPSPPTTAQDGDSQVPCCQPTSQETVPIVYVDELSTLTISSVQLTRRCGCGPDNLQQPREA